MRVCPGEKAYIICGMVTIVKVKRLHSAHDTNYVRKQWLQANANKIHNDTNS